MGLLMLYSFFSHLSVSVSQFEVFMAKLTNVSDTAAQQNPPKNSHLHFSVLDSVVLKYCSCCSLPLFHTHAVLQPRRHTSIHTSVQQVWYQGYMWNINLP